MSPIVATPSSKPCSPISSTDLWRICHPGRFGANAAWILCAAIAHNLLRAVGILAGGAHAVARGATLRRKIVTIAARLARPQRRPVLHLPSHWPWAHDWLALWRNTIGYSPPTTITP